MGIQLPEEPTPTNPPVGQWELWIDDVTQTLNLKDTAGNILNLSSLNIQTFGTEFQEASDDSVTTTTSSTFNNKVSLVTPSLPSGNYRIEWSYQWNYNQGTTDFVGQVINTTTADSYMVHRQEPKDTGGAGFGGSDQQHVTSGFAIRSLNGVNTIELNYSAGSAGQITAIWNARLAIWRVS